MSFVAFDSSPFEIHMDTTFERRNHPLSLFLRLSNVSKEANDLKAAESLDPSQNVLENPKPPNVFENPKDMEQLLDQNLLREIYDDANSLTTALKLHFKVRHSALLS